MTGLARLLGGAVLVKAHVTGYVRQDGTHVDDYERGGAAAPKPKHYVPPPVPHKVVGAQFGGKLIGISQKSLLDHAPKPKPKAWHPELNEKGEKVGIYKPHKATGPDSWAHGDQVAVVTPGGAVPAQLNGVPFAKWTDAPTAEAAWEDVDGQADIDEPDFHCPSHLEPAAGAVIVEPDGRYVIVSPTNGYGGAPNVFPKGRTEDMPLQATAIKEAFEESGLKIEITGFLGDFDRTMTRTRFYLARRVGGTPAACGWETQAVSFVPQADLPKFLTGNANKGVLEACMALNPGQPEA